MPDKQNIHLCSVGAIRDPGSRGLTVQSRQGPRDILLVRKGGRIFGYLNSCPHTGVGLDWMPDQFLDNRGCFIQCATHGALFRIEDGLCLKGPCVGDRLRPIDVVVESGEVFMSDDGSAGQPG